jgi:hypothetical protein
MARDAAMDHPNQTRIMQNGAGWYWEIVTQDRQVTARGAAETHAQARVDAERAASRRVPVSLEA